MKSIVISYRLAFAYVSGPSAYARARRPQAPKRRTSKFAVAFLLISTLILGAAPASLTTAQKRGLDRAQDKQPEFAVSLQSAQSIVAKQAALVSEFEVN